MSRARECFGAGGLSLLLNGWALGLKMLAPFYLGQKDNRVFKKERGMRIIMRKLLIVLLCLGMVGCVMTQPYYNPTPAQILEQQWKDHADPNSSSFYDKWFPAKCDSCNRVFHFSGYDASFSKTTGCEYCDSTQDLEKACKRALYDGVQEIRQAQLNAMALQPIIIQQGPSMAQMWLQQSYQRNQQETPSYMRPGSIWNPINVKVQR